MSTATLDLAPYAGHPVIAAAQEIHALLDRVEVSAPLSGAEHATAVREWARAGIRLQAVQLRLLAAAEDAEVAIDAGLPDTGAWLSRQTRSGGASAARQVRLANALAQRCAATGAALEDGDLTVEHAEVIVSAAAQLPESLDDAQRAKVETALVDKARQLDPAALRRAARRALEAVTADQAAIDAHADAVLRSEEERAWAKVRLTMHDNCDGTVSGHFVVPTVAGAILRKVIQQMVSPRRARLGASLAQAGSQGLAIDWPHRQGEAFSELLEHLPTDHLHGKVAATIVATVELSRLRSALGAAGLDCGEELSVGGVRRLACGAGILPAMLDGPSQPLDLGRTQRFFTEAQRVSGATRHRSCAADGCDRPYAWCELHHRQAWQDGGPTDGHNMVALCGFHHRRIHDRSFEHHHRSDGSITFHRRR